jgi:hypothetical protein
MGIRYINPKSIPSTDLPKIHQSCRSALVPYASTCHSEYVQFKMKFSVLSLIILSSFVSAIPAPQRGGGNRGRPSASVATQAAATPAASQAGATSAASAVSAPAVSTKASAAAGTTAAGETTAGGAAGTAAGGTAPAGTAAAGTAAAGSGTSSGGTGHLITVCPPNLPSPQTPTSTPLTLP